jgi:hypothetical protein
LSPRVTLDDCSFIAEGQKKREIKEKKRVRGGKKRGEEKKEEKNEKKKGNEQELPAVLQRMLISKFRI